jgi:hypothetical protein
LRNPKQPARKARMPTARSPKTLYEMYGVQVNQSIRELSALSTPVAIALKSLIQQEIFR